MLEKFFAAKLCKSSAAQIGYIPILTPRLIAAPTAINTNLLIAMEVNFPALNLMHRHVMGSSSYPQNDGQI
jgi:hypothetical protein